MWHLVWSVNPGVSPPDGVTGTPQADGSYVVEGPRDLVAGWQLELLRSGKLWSSQMLVSAEGAFAPPPVQISRAEYDAVSALLALPAGATAAQLRNATTAVRTARRGS